MDSNMLICILCISCISSNLAALTGAYYYFTEINTTKWGCISSGTDDSPMYIVGRVSKGDAECMYSPKDPGCFIIPADSSKPSDVKKAIDECKNFISAYPKVNTSSGKILDLEAYRCGATGQNFKEWGNTGYESPNDLCYKIKNQTKIFPI